MLASDAANKIIEIAKKWQKTRAEIAEADFNARVKNAQPGESVPDKGRIELEIYVNELRDEARDLQSQALEVLQNYRDSVTGEKGAAPSDEAVRAVQMLALRSNIERSDIDALVARYGGNYETFKTLKDIAAQHDLRGYSHPLEEIEKSCEGVESLIFRSFNYFDAIKEEVSAANVAIFAAAINQYLNVKETA